MKSHELNTPHIMLTVGDDEPRRGVLPTDQPNSPMLAFYNYILPNKNPAVCAVWACDDEST